MENENVKGMRIEEICKNCREDKQYHVWKDVTLQNGKKETWLMCRTWFNDKPQTKENVSFVPEVVRT